jgi:hypothetical protein
MLVRIASIFLVIVGAAGFTAPFWIDSVVKDAGAIELPLVEIEDSAVSDDGRVFFALMPLGRIQIYDGAGKFVRNFPIDSSGGAFCLDVDGNRITVAIARRDAADEIDLGGRPLRLNAPIDEKQYSVACQSDPRVRSVERTWETVVVKFADDRPSLTLNRKWWHYLAYGPFGSWLMFMVGLLLWPEWRRAIFKRMFGRG